MLKIFVWKRNGVGANIKRRLWMDPDSTITFKLNNPLVSELGLFSYPLTVPYQENKHVFNFPGDGNATPENYDFELFIGSERFIDGEVQIINADGIELYFKSGNSSVSAMLKNTFLDENLNGVSFGQFSDSADKVSKMGLAKSGKFPAFDFAAPVIKTPESIEQRVCFYLRFLLRKITGALNYVLIEDQSNIVEDFNRVFLYTNKRFTARVSVIPYSDFLPHVSVSEFLKDVQKRFNLFVYLSPQNRRAYILHLDNVFSMEPKDWTHKFISNEDLERYGLKNVSFENDGEEEDVLTDEQIAQITFYNETANSEYGLIVETRNANYDEGDFLLTTNSRVYKGTKQSPSRSFQDDYYLRKGTYQTSWKTMDVGVPFEYSEAATNSSTNADTLNLIQQFAFPELEGSVNEVIHLRIWAQKNQSGDHRLICILYESTEPDADIIAFHEMPVSDTDELERNFFLFLNKGIELTTSARMALKIFEYHPAGVAPGTITIKYGGVEYGTGLRRDSIINIDREYFKFREYGVTGNYSSIVDINADAFENKPSGLVLTNTRARWNGLTYQMPESTIKKERLPKKYGWSVYRGQISNEFFRHPAISSQFPGLSPFACFDDKGLFYEDYSPFLTDNDPHSLSLRWTGANGLLQKCFLKTIPFRRHFGRKVTKRLSLSVNDIINADLYKPVKIGSQKYLISELSIPIKANGNIGEVTAELLTI